MRLDLVTQSWTERQAFLYAEVVLDVRGGLQAPIRDVRIADAANVAARRAGDEVVEALERIGAEIVRRLVRAQAQGVELHAGANRVLAAHVIEVRRDGRRRRAPRAGQLLAARRKGIEHANRGRLQDRLQRV